MSSNTHIFPRFLTWYFVREPLAILRGYAGYAKALFEIVPFGFLLLTLFRPWKNIVDRRTDHGINIQHIIERMSLSFLARGTGCVVRLFAIACGIMLQALLLVTTTLYLCSWITAPLWSVYLVLRIVSPVLGL